MKLAIFLAILSILSSSEAKPSLHGVHQNQNSILYLPIIKNFFMDLKQKLSESIKDLTKSSEELELEALERLYRPISNSSIRQIKPPRPAFSPFGGKKRLF